MEIVRIGQSDSDANQRDQQRKAWLASNRESQELLKQHGFYTGKIDGIAGRQMTEAIRRFQAANDLESTGVLDARTNERLRALAAERALKSINNQAPGMLVATIAHTPRDVGARYKVYTGSGSPLYAGNDTTQLAEALQVELQRPGVDTLYLDLEGRRTRRGAAGNRLRNGSRAGLSEAQRGEESAKIKRRLRFLPEYEHDS